MTVVVDRVSYSYPGTEDFAVRDVSLEVRPGDVVGIVGPNGSGKSTLGRLIKGLLLPTAGSVVVDGRDTLVDGLAVRRHVGLVFQNPNSQIVNAVVEQEVAFGPENIGLPSDEIRRRVVEALAAVGLRGHEQSECHSLSMADKQRVAIAAAIAMHPDYLVLDEPTAWLEPPVRWPLLREVLRWAQERQGGLILVTHRMEEMQICGRVHGMRHGRVEVSGSPDEILTNPDLRARLALDVPDTFRLGEDLHAVGLPVRAGTPLDELAEVIAGGARAITPDTVTPGTLAPRPSPVRGRGE